MKSRHTLVLIAALGAAHLVLSAWQHRQRLALDAANMHANMLTAEDTWYVPGDGPRDEYVPMAQVNRLIVCWSVKHRIGLLKRQALRSNAAWLMKRRIARAYWAKWRDHRIEEARDRKDVKFVTTLDDAYYDAKDDIDSAV